MRVLALNAGSRSHIARIYEVGEPVPFEPSEPLWQASVESASATFDDLLAKYDGPAPDGAGHRVVHPGIARISERSAPIDDVVRQAIESATPLAPGHNPLALEGIAAVARRFGDQFAQVAVFDTALDADAPAVATTYPIPAEWTQRYGIRRAGFHGISHRDAVGRVARLAADAGRPASRIASVHMGNGCSIAGFRDGKCVEHTMGFTPMEGLMMGSRSGSVDPGIILWLIRECGLDAADVENGLGKHSGLVGVSGISSDTRDLEAAVNEGDERAALALELYVHKLRTHLGGIIAALDGIDALSFTGPVGEHMADLRRSACAGFEYLGLRIDERRNEAAQPDAALHDEASRVGIYVIRTLEEWAVASEAARVITTAKAGVRATR